ncbi:MAG TPA: F0F1 ATP synthase subunit B [Chloroflexota bacterium]|nr:F0F1 ATP synthase subunit B [Chloroflexota bacterium]
MLAANVVLWWAAQLVAIAILVLLFLRWRPKFTGRRTVGEIVGSLLDARETQIRQQLAAADEAREEARRLHEEAQQDIVRARGEAEEIVSRAARTGELIREDMDRHAREEYDRIVAQARVEIDLERERAESALRRRAADIVIDAAGQVVERELTPQADAGLINSSLDNLGDIR